MKCQTLVCSFEWSVLPIMNITIIGRLDFILELTVFETDNLAKAVFTAMFTKGDNFCDFMFASLDDQAPASKIG